MMVPGAEYLLLVLRLYPQLLQFIGLLRAPQVSRPNFGLTLDTGHLLMAGENVAQSIAMTAAQGALFGLQARRLEQTAYMFFETL